MRKYALTLLLAIASALQALSATVSLRGKAPDYAAKNLVVSTYADYVSHLRRDIASFVVGTDGTFSTEIEISEITYAYIDLGSYWAYIYLEPGARYEVVLPPLRPKADADRFNPFYRPEMIELGIVGATSNLNKAIRDFDNFFGRTFPPAAVRLVRQRDKALADKLIARTDSAMRAAQCDKAFFRQHVRYRQAQIYASARMNARRAVLSKYYAQSPVLFNLPAYWQTLEQMAPDIFSDPSRPDVSKKMRKEMDADQIDFARLSETAASDTLWAANANLREAVILKNLHDNFYTKNITDEQSDASLMSSAAKAKAKRNRLTAANIYAKKNKLKAGLPAPELDLVDDKDHSVNIANFRGRFLYICFMHTENYECLKAMPALENLGQVHRADMDILCIFTNENADEAYAYVRDNRFSWQAVSFITNQKLIFDYEVQALPTYFLIDPDGCISMAQAPGPTEKVGPAIANAIREYKLTTLRGRKEVPRTIYDIANGK